MKILKFWTFFRRFLFLKVLLKHKCLISYFVVDNTGQIVAISFTAQTGEMALRITFDYKNYNLHSQSVYASDSPWKQHTQVSFRV